MGAAVILIGYLAVLGSSILSERVADSGAVRIVSIALLLAVLGLGVEVDRQALGWFLAAALALVYALALAFVFNLLHEDLVRSPWVALAAAFALVSAVFSAVLLWPWV